MCSQLSTSDALSRLRAKYDTRITSDDKSPFPLHAFLTMYQKADHYGNECYIDYYEGLELLAKWLGPIEIPETVPDNVPAMLYSSPVVDVARILAGTFSSLERKHHVQRAIIATLIKEVK